MKLDKIKTLPINEMARFYNFCAKKGLVLLFVEEEVVLGRVVGPDVLDGFINVALVLDLLQVLEHLERCARTNRIIDQLVLGGGPGGILQFGCQLKRPIHNPKILSPQSQQVTRAGGNRSPQADVQKYKKIEKNKQISANAHPIYSSEVRTSYCRRCGTLFFLSRFRHLAEGEGAGIGTTSTPLRVTAGAVPAVWALWARAVSLGAVLQPGQRVTAPCICISTALS